MPPVISVIIPTYKRDALLRWTVREFINQTLRPDLFEVVVAVDGGHDLETETLSLFTSELPFPLSLVYVPGNVPKGPATARNLGVQKSVGKIILFVGDDCIPDRNLLWRHHIARLDRPNVKRIVQGYTPWHPAIPPDDFMQFLFDSGLQANWGALKNENGSWKREINGTWFLTTNVSVDRYLFESENGFNERFPAAAWEDIEFAYRLAKKSVPIMFEPDAINYHHHKQTLGGFAKRQIREGGSRLVFASLHSEISSSLLDPNGVRETTRDQYQAALKLAEEFHFSQEPDIQEIRRQRWGAAMRLASLEGIRQGALERGGIWQALLHIHTGDAARGVVSAATFAEAGDFAYASYEIETILRRHPDNWALQAARGEAFLLQGDLDRADESFQRAAVLGVGETWPVSGLERIKEKRAG